MHSQAGVEHYTFQNIPPVDRPISRATEWYNDQPRWFTDQPTWYTHQQIMKFPPKAYLLTTNFDKVLEQRQPVRDFIPQLETLHRYYTIVDDDRTIIELLQEEPQLYPLLLDAVEPLQQTFGNKRLIYIRVQTSDEDSILKVTIWLPTNFGGDPERVLQDFDKEWWLKNCHRSGGALVFDYEMQNAI
jgi:hypothetical protein